jgi:hypothetical protein
MTDKSIKIFVIIIIAILLVSSIFAYNYMLKDEEENDEDEDDEIQIDDRISPYTNQGLIVEINRIRNRGLMEKMLKIGTSWRNAPTFFWIVTVDGKECNSKGNVGPYGAWTKWDTFGEDSSASFYIEEEQETSEINIKVIEEKTSGLIFKKTSEEVKFEINLNYDYRTGRWAGDDSLKDSDGYGHVLDDTYEVWFHIYQSDYDQDGIPFWVEKNVLGTDPTIDDSNSDPDNDLIPTTWEWFWDYDPFVYNDHKNLDTDIDGIDNVEEYQVRKWFSNPYQPDIYIETDGMQKRGLIDLPHEFFKESQQMLIERFAQHGINVYIDDGWPDGPVNGGGEKVQFIEYMDDVEGKQGLAFYRHNFADERKGIFRYVLVGNRHGGIVFPVNYNQFDMMEIGSGLRPTFKTRLAFTPRAIYVGLAKAVLHELGHSLGLMPITFEGNDIQPKSWGDRYPSMDEEEYNKFVQQYHSIMNYIYIFDDRKLFDYSDGSNGEPYDQDDWLYIYLPAFQTDQLSYEESVDESFEDFEVVNNYPGIIAQGWEYDKNLTEKYYSQFEELAIVKNTGVNISVYVNSDKDEESDYNLRVYAMPNVYPVFAVWSLVAEGKLDSDGDVNLYSIQEEINKIYP